MANVSILDQITARVLLGKYFNVGPLKSCTYDFLKMDTAKAICDFFRA